MKVKIIVDIGKDTDKILLENKLKDWLSDNFWKGSEAEITLEEEK